MNKIYNFTELKKLNKKKLVSILKKYNINYTGNKTELINRILDFQKNFYQKGINYYCFYLFN